MPLRVFGAASVSLYVNKTSGVHRFRDYLDEIRFPSCPDHGGEVGLYSVAGDSMPMSNSNNTRKGRKPYMVAVVLGAALAALGSPEKAAASEVSDQALGGISRYCSACWRNARLPVDRWGDCTQEVFARLLERIPLSGWKQVLTGDSAERREFLRAIDTVKKRHKRDRARTSGLCEPVADSRDMRDSHDSDHREALQLAADRVLSARQQRILQMICEGYAVSDIAGALAIPAERVSDEKYKAIQKLRTYFEAHPEAAA
jgi:RNA polymerase sigma factor (sigma-70 family)